MNLHLNYAPAASLEIRDVICGYGERVVVERARMTIQPGEHVALIGSNGSGKTTLLRAMLGLHEPTSGEILLDGNVARSSSEWRTRRRRIAWMPQRQATGSFPLLVRELLASGGNSVGLQSAAGQLGVWELRERAVHTLSGGQLQRVFLARALVSLIDGAGLLLADEPTAALDFEGQAAVADVIAGLPSTVVVVSHDRTMANRCHRVMEMAGGKLREISR